MTRAVDDLSALIGLEVDRRSSSKLYLQLYLKLRDAILAGRLVSGTRLPSTRQLCDDLKISRTVAITAYEQLGLEGFITARRGSGQYVSRLERQDVHVSPASRATSTRRAAPIPYLPFDTSVGVLDAFPHDEWAKHLARGWRCEYERVDCQADQAGLPALRSAIRHHLHALKGVVCTENQIVVTSGLHDALGLIVEALRVRQSPKSSMWTEDPGYLGARLRLELAGMNVVPIPVDRDGLMVSEGIRLARRARAALVTPSRQFPLGMQLSLQRRIDLLAWAKAESSLIIEDEYDSEIRFSGHPLNSLFSIDPDRVCMTGSFSKLTFPGLRVGYVVASSEFAARMVAARIASGTPLPTSTQPALADFIMSGGFSRHLREQRRRLKSRREVLTTTLHRLLGDDLTILPQEAGMHLTVLSTDRLRARTSDVELANRGLGCGLCLEPLSRHTAAVQRAQGLVMGYAAWDEKAIANAVARLSALIKRTTRL